MNMGTGRIYCHGRTLGRRTLTRIHVPIHRDGNRLGLRKRRLGVCVAVFTCPDTGQPPPDLRVYTRFVPGKSSARYVARGYTVAGTITELRADGTYALLGGQNIVKKETNA